MKKIIYSAMAVAMLATTSCKDDFAESFVGDQATVEFSISTPEIGTRAYSDGTTATKLQYAVYDAAGEELTALTKTDGEIKGSTTVSLELTTGETYSVIFWAAAPEAPYTVDFGTKTMTVNYTGAKSNDEKRDAFYKYHTFTVSGAQTETIELRRPFAQLNIGTEDYQKATDAGYTPNYSYVKVPVSSTLNLKDGSVGEASPITFGVAPIKKDETFPVAGNQYISMNYLLVPADKGLVDVEFGYSETETGKAKTRTISNVPVQRNYRTNIYGKLLTSTVDVNVEIEPDFNEPAHGLAALQNAALNGGEVTLTEDVVLTTPLEVYGKMTINLNGRTITTALKEEGRHHYAIDNYATLVIEGKGAINARGIQNFGEMTINGDITITNVDTNGGAAIWNEGRLTINNGTFTTNDQAGVGSYGAALNTRPNGEAVVNSGTFEAYSQLTYAIINEGKTVINNATVKGKHGAVGSVKTNDQTTINGGSFELMENPSVSDHCTYYVSDIRGGKFTLGNNTDSGAQVFYESKIADGYTTVADGEWYKVVPVVVKQLMGVTTATTVELTENVVVRTGQTIQTQDAKGAITIDGNGKSLVSVANSVDDFQWENGTIPYMSTILSSDNGAKVTVNNLNFEGTMSALMLGHYVDSNSNWYNTELNNVNVINTKVVSFSQNIAPAVCIYGTAVLDNCNMYGTTLSELDTDPMWPVYDVAAVNYSTTTVKGGKIGSFFLWNQAGLILDENAEVEKIVIRGNMNRTKYGVQIINGSKVHTLDLSAITDRTKVNIKVENGATIGKIVANGVEYATVQDFVNGNPKY